ncbi:MAG: hypothetical protein IJE43_07985 [Alphaproteobacteria bacterium]|nr:hypothetical protein [Alphaproteobacteria bacterium]
MAQYVTKIRTESGDLPVDYASLANLPQSDATLTQSGAFADAKATGDAINQVKDSAKQLDENKADKTSIPTKVSELENDAQYLASVPDEYVTDSELTDAINALPVLINDEEISETTSWSSNKTSQELLAKDQEVAMRDRVYNYLDNSNLLHPINQRLWVSKTALTATTEIPKVYFLDRWCVDNGTVSPELNVSGLITNGNLVCQCLERNRLVGKTITAAIGLSNGQVIVGCGEVSGLNASDLGDRINVAQNAIDAMKNEDGQLKTDVSEEDYKNAEALLAKLKYLQESNIFGGIQNDTGNLLLKMKDDSDSGLLNFYMSSDKSAAIQWAALYEGIYTSDTLPRYQTKDYITELLECKRYFRKLEGGMLSGFITSNVCIVGLPMDVPMRVKPSIVVSDVATLRGAGKKITPTSITVHEHSNGRLLLNVNYDDMGNEFSNNVGVLGYGAAFTLSADL